MDYSQDPDVALMLAFQQGDVKAFETLIARYQNVVVNSIARYVRDRAEAEDLAQDVFFRVYRASAKYTPQAKFSTWLFRIVTNMCLNEIRDRGRHKILSLAPDEVLTQHPSREPGGEPSHGIQQRETRDQVRAAIDALPDTQRLAIIYDKYQDLSYEEIGVRMKLSPMAVKSLLSRARENLRLRLEPLLRQGLAGE